VGNVDFAVIDNPEMNGINDNDTKVGQIVNSGENFENAFFNFDVPLDFSMGNTITMKLFSSQAIPLLLKFEDGTQNPVEVNGNHGGTGWEELSFTFESTASYNDMVLFVDAFGTAVGTFFVDDIMQTDGGGSGETGGNCSDELIAAQTLPVNFEGCETFLQEFNFGSGLTSGLAMNPDMSGINTSDWALKVDKNAGADFFAGVQNNFAETFPDLTDRLFRMKIYSTKPNTVFRFEVAQDNPDVGNPPGAFVTVADANVWTEVEFSFTAIPAPSSYFRLVIKPDNDMTDSPITADGTYYFDDIELLD